MKPEKLREMSDVELREQLDGLRKDVFQAQFRAGQDEVEERGKTRKLRREVARIQTILREREMRVRGAGGAAGETEEG